VSAPTFELQLAANGGLREGEMSVYAACKHGRRRQMPATGAEILRTRAIGEQTFYNVKLTFHAAMR